MAKHKNNHFIHELLGDSFVQQVVKEFKLDTLSADVQAELLAQLGENIYRRVMLEVLTALPEEARDEFETFVGSGDVVGMRAFLDKNIDGVDELIRHHATKEYESTKTGMLKKLQGVE